MQRIGSNPVGGTILTVIGGGGVRYYYTHLSGFGNTSTAPPHLHFGVYTGESYLTGNWDAENPYALIIDRVW